MRKAGWTPSIAPRDHGQTVYLVLDDLGSAGRNWAGAETTDLETVVADLLDRAIQEPGPNCQLQHG